jgi:Ca-activated chloride channel family protein
MTSQTATCIFGLVLSLAISIGETDAQSVSRPATFRTASRMVLVPFTVTDHSGKTVPDLQAKDFDIFDDQKPQQIVSFAYEDAPCTIGLALDISGSMTNTLGFVKEGANSFVRMANREDEFLFLTVSTLPSASPGFTNDVAELEQDISFARPGGFTALVDTVYLGLNRMREAPHPRRALLILSDGMDNHSRYSKRELLRVALEADVQIYTIIIDNGAANTSPNGIPYRPSMIAKPGDLALARQGPNLLEELANKTGGLYFHAANGDKVKEAMTRVGQALRSQYLIGYQPVDSGLSGKWHRIHVKTTMPKVHIYARSGYYAP